VNPRSLRNRVLLSILLGVIVFAGLTFYADFKAVGESLADFQWAYLPLILGLTSVNYVLRFFKWEYYLNLIGVRGLSRKDSFLIFFSGLGMVITPGKVGEWLKSYFLREVHGTPIARSAPILIAERLTDTVALVIMCSVGVFVFGQLWQVFVLVLAGAVVFIVIMRHRPTAMALLRLGARMPVVKRFTPQLEEFYESTYVMLGPRPLLLMSGLSTLSWFFEVLAFFFTLVGMGQDPSGELMLYSAFILPIATLASALLLTPGGLGVAEASLQALLENLLDMSKSAAAVSTLIIRFGTLWWGVIIGLGAFAVLSRRLAIMDREMLEEALDKKLAEEQAARAAPSAGEAPP
jgi:uncharacterized protein (TIRG00374 family)